MKNIVILGSTGSIGKQTLEIARAFPERFNILGLAAWNNVDLLSQQIAEFTPSYIFYNQQTPLSVATDLTFMSMEEMVCQSSVDLIVIATTGKAGLLPLVKALETNKNIAFANKEPMVMAGEHLKVLREKHSGLFLPIDSEPNAIWQCLEKTPSEIANIIITASGGPFRNHQPSQLTNISPEQALKHPTWNMGQRITIDSALLMNKGFEVIESHWLFDMAWEKIKVVIHPQSIIHSMVTFIDGSVKALLSPPDMRIPIQYALSYPERLPNLHTKPIEPANFSNLTFQSLNIQQYPCFSLALDAGIQGETFPAVLTASDEIAVTLFLANKIRFTDIHKLLTKVLDQHKPTTALSLESILEADEWARRKTLELANQLN